ncbi:Hypothetical protein NTJ_00644 [Nesidiocoris tenuis]|uniref:Uncharacterized protein n=1 Tax=Nesidiocoris tenuis TaxID=355587 RepID=A0ABN7A6H4_9HEMI|nr:Hypothetical protein NTJ_00644 [Nesidiocoris tenuis]
MIFILIGKEEIKEEEILRMKNAFATEKRSAFCNLSAIYIRHADQKRSTRNGAGKNYRQLFGAGGENGFDSCSYVYIFVRRLKRNPPITADLT